MITESSLATRWPKVPLGEVVEFLDHLRRPVTANDRIPGPYPYYGANGQQDSVAGFIFDEPLVLLAEDGGAFGDPGKTIAYSVNGKCWVNNHAHVLRASNKLDVRFLCRHLERYDISPYVAGTTRSKLTKGQAERIPIALPSLVEQRRIADVLDKADAIRRKRRAACLLSETTNKAAFLDWFGHPARNPKHFPRLLLEELCERITVGHVGPMAEQYLDAGVPFLRSLNVRRGRIDLKNVKYVTKEFHALLKKSMIRAGDVVTVRTGQPGTTAVVPDSLPEANCADLIVMTCGSRLNQQYLCELLNLWLGDADSIMGQVGAIQIHFNIGSARELLIPVPPLAQQREFASVVAGSGHLVATQSTGVTRADNLFHSLVQRAFRGEL